MFAIASPSLKIFSSRFSENFPDHKLFPFSTRSSEGSQFEATYFKEKEEKYNKMKYVLVTGGVVSGLGKGVTASSIGLLLKACGLRVTSIKIGLFLFF